LRYDNASFTYNDLATGPDEEKSKSFDKLNPRLSVVFAPSQKFSLKIMGGQAFRTPSVSELFGYNTYLLASNISNLKPETITTFELASDLAIGSNLNWRFNAYYTEFNDQIAYSSSNLSTNLYSLTNVGFENEFTFQVNKFDGFLNHSFTQRVDEEIVDSNIGISKDEMTWVPQQILNIGLKYTEKKFYISAQGHYQGEVNRRSTDMDPAVDAIRGTKVDAWFTVDFRLAYKPISGIEVGFIGTNLSDNTGKLLKNGAAPFDYQIPGRSLLVDFRFMF
jgi:iron complex outermembrane receptor protein